MTKKGKPFRDRVSSLDIKKEFGIEQLLLCVESSQLRFFRNLIRMPSPMYCGSILDTSNWRPWSKPRRSWRDLISHLAWERPGIPYEELEDIAGENHVWATD